jgi:hypothetical protein
MAKDSDTGLMIPQCALLLKGWQAKVLLAGLAFLLQLTQRVLRIGERTVSGEGEERPLRCLAHLNACGKGVFQFVDVGDD